MTSPAESKLEAEREGVRDLSHLLCFIRYYILLACVKLAACCGYVHACTMWYLVHNRIHLEYAEYLVEQLVYYSRLRVYKIICYVKFTWSGVVIRGWLHEWGDSYLFSMQQTRNTVRKSIWDGAPICELADCRAPLLYQIICMVYWRYPSTCWERCWVEGRSDASTVTLQAYISLH